MLLPPAFPQSFPALSRTGKMQITPAISYHNNSVCEVPVSGILTPDHFPEYAYHPLFAPLPIAADQGISFESVL